MAGSLVVASPADPLRVREGERGPGGIPARCSGHARPPVRSTGTVGGGRGPSRGHGREMAGILPEPASVTAQPTEEPEGRRITPVGLGGERGPTSMYRTVERLEGLSLL